MVAELGHIHQKFLEEKVFVAEMELVHRCLATSWLEVKDGVLC